jgi:hypothetical protein
MGQSYSRTAISYGVLYGVKMGIPIPFKTVNSRMIKCALKELPNELPLSSVIDVRDWCPRDGRPVKIGGLRFSY